MGDVLSGDARVASIAPPQAPAGPMGQYPLVTDGGYGAYKGGGKRSYDGGGLASPCFTFAASRWWDDGGRPPLRDEFAPEIFDFKQWERGRGICIAMRCMEIIDWMISNHRSARYETPRRKAGHPFVFKLPAALEIAG